MRNISRVIFILLFLSFQNCIDEITETNSVFSFENSALILREIEERGDYLNSANFPAFKSASELNSNLANYIIIDVRTAEEFSSGHIQNAVNINNFELFDYIKEVSNNNKPIVFVSNTGQAASYYTSIFRLYGYSNIYSLKFGMASWNKDFAHYYTDNIRKLSSPESYHNVNNPKPDFKHLPLIGKDKNLTINDFFEQRIRDLLADGFYENNSSVPNQINTVDLEYFNTLINSGFIDNFVICFANTDLFFKDQLGVFENPGHPKGAVLYKAFYPFAELCSVNYLQTVPVSKQIIMYSFSGELSAMGIAHLRLLGYDAKSLLFGYHILDYQRLITSPALAPYAYQKQLVQDLPYVN